MVDRRAGLNIGVDSTTGAVLAGVQVRRLLEPDDHLTIRLPPLFIDVVGQVPAESARREIRVGADRLEVVPTEGNDVFVGGQKAVSLQLAETALRFAAQQGLNLLRDERSAEHSGERVVESRFELALQTRNEASLATHTSALPRTCDGTSPAPSKGLTRVPCHQSMVSAESDVTAASES